MKVPKDAKMEKNGNGGVDVFSTPGSTYTPEIANKVFGIVKASAKAN